MITPVDMDCFEQLLKLYRYDTNETQFIIDGFRNGFDLGYRGETTNIRRDAPNLKFRIGDLIIWWNQVMKEVKLKRYTGPFKSPPFENYIQSPIGLVPKDGGKDVRLIFHLSYPRTGKSVNSETPAELCSVKYPDFSEAIRKCIEIVNRHGTCFISKSDAKSAFHNLGIKPEHWPWLLMTAKSPIDDQWYYFVDKCLPFGSSISCSHYQHVSDSIAYLTTCVNKDSPINYLDDYLFAAYLHSLCNQYMQAFIDICNDIQFPVSMEKTFWANTTLVLLGLLIDAVNGYVAIPVDKVERAIILIQDILTHKKTTVKQLQRLCGFLNFLCKCIVPGRAFTRRLYSKFSSVMKPHYHVNINGEMK